MQPIEARRRSRSGAEAATGAASQEWEQEWRDAAVVERTEAVAAAQEREKSDRLILAAGIASVGAAVIHLSVAKMHFQEYTLFGVFFVLSGIAQLVWPAWLLLRRWRPLLALGAIGNALLVALWAVDRIWGLPIGPEHWQPESVGFGDVVTVGFELFVVAACLVLMRGRGAGLRRPAMLAVTLATVALTTLSLLSVLGVGSSWLPATA